MLINSCGFINIDKYDGPELYYVFNVPKIK